MVGSRAEGVKGDLAHIVCDTRVLFWFEYKYEKADEGGVKEAALQSLIKC